MAESRTRSRGPRILAGIAVLVLAAGLTFAAAQWLDREAAPAIGAVVLERTGATAWPEPDGANRTVDPYRGLGAWADAFDYSPSYTGPDPPVTPDDVTDMAAHGVRTLYLQAGRLDDRSPDLLEDRWVLAEFLMRAHEEGVAVVGWYLPYWTEDDADLRHLQAIADFSVLGHRFDGVAVDIEWNQDGLTVAERNRRLVELSATLRAHVGDDALGAIVVPPVLMEVVNPRFWPSFPWGELAPLYDVWLPMSYWSFRTEASGYRDGYRYNEESIRRMRTNLALPEAPVHAIGGIGSVEGPPGQVVDGEPLASIDDLEGFVRSLVDTGAIGGSLYDWRVTDPPSRVRLQELFSAHLPHLASE